VSLAVLWALNRNTTVLCCDTVLFDIFNCNWVATRWQYYSTHLHTNSTQNDTKQTIHRIQKIERHKNIGNLVRPVPQLCVFNTGICLTTEEKPWKSLSQGTQRVPTSLVDSYRWTCYIHPIVPGTRAQDVSSEPSYVINMASECNIRQHM
jgi:hypothetical protein